MRRLLLAALIAPLLTGCDPATPGTDPIEEPGPTPAPIPDTVPAIAFAVIEGTVTRHDTALANIPVTYSCGPGLFSDSTMTDAAGRYDFTLRFPDTLKADLPSDRQLGCMVQIPNRPDYRKATDGRHVYSVPLITFVEQQGAAQPFLVDIDPYQPRDPGAPEARQSLLLELRPGETKYVPPLPCYPRCTYFGVPLHPDLAEATPWGNPGSGLSIKGTAVGTTTIMVYGIYRLEHGTPEGWKVEIDTALAGAFGVRVR